ncbi:15524_t:CDS:2 [Dentiscutata erythropus]|uniref:15524_t:CDS:1 n=1 Tax=Dentiscutata erythropus TaxID=1348616 RepID=A0A9N9CFG5_9GLOM|nr:15524_t:CDS:2 [Dentiscutata erythropus]
MTLFIPTTNEERDPNTQSIFEMNEYYCVSEKIMVGFYNRNLRLKRDLASNRYSLKFSLVGIAHSALKKINRKSAVINVLVNDYAGQVYSFAIQVVFLYHNTWFKHLISSTWLNDSMLFVVEQMEVIEKEVYVYAVDIFYVDFSVTTKKKVSISESTPALYRTVRLRLLNVHKSVNKGLSKVDELKNSYLDNETSDVVTDLTSEDSHVDKRIRLEDEKDDCTEYDDGCMNEYNKEYSDVSGKYKGGSNSSECSYRSSNKSKKKIF